METPPPSPMTMPTHDKTIDQLLAELDAECARTNKKVKIGGAMSGLSLAAVGPAMMDAGIHKISEQAVRLPQEVTEVMTYIHHLAHRLAEFQNQDWATDTVARATLAGGGVIIGGTIGYIIGKIAEAVRPENKSLSQVTTQP